VTDLVHDREAEADVAAQPGAAPFIAAESPDGVEAAKLGITKVRTGIGNP
jgi:hypothetical protein